MLIDTINKILTSDKVSLRKLAIELNCSHSWLSQILSGSREPNLDLLRSVDGSQFANPNEWFSFNGRLNHWVEPFEGERYSIIIYNRCYFSIAMLSLVKFLSTYKS